MTENAILMVSFRCELLLQPRELCVCAYAVLYIAPCAGKDGQKKKKERVCVCV